MTNAVDKRLSFALETAAALLESGEDHHRHVKLLAEAYEFSESRARLLHPDKSELLDAVGLTLRCAFGRLGFGSYGVYAKAMGPTTVVANLRTLAKAAEGIVVEPAPPRKEPGMAVWMASVDTENTQVQGFGMNPAEALEAMLITWRDDFSPYQGADPRYLDEIRDSVSVRKVLLGKGYAIGTGDKFWSEKDGFYNGEDDSLADVWDRYLAECPRPAPRY